jgi:uncharacterized protein involved in exopolysaccharide biosynthesis
MVSPLVSKDSATLGDFVGLLRLRQSLVFLVLAIVVLTTLGVTALLPKWYLSTAKISVQKPESEVKLFQAQNNAYYDPYFVQQQVEIIQAEKILYQVSTDLGLGAILSKQVNDGHPMSAADTYQYLIRKMLRVRYW